MRRNAYRSGPSAQAWALEDKVDDSKAQGKIIPRHWRRALSITRDNDLQ